MKKKIKKRYKRRVLIYSFLIFFIGFSILDYYCETVGLPDSYADYFQNKLRLKGLMISFEKIKVGVIHGFVLINPSLYDPEVKDYIFKADKLKIGVKLSPFDGKFFRLASFSVVNGDLDVPLFPENGEEGKSDILEIDSINASFDFDGEYIELEYFTGELAPFEFSVAGIIDNIYLKTFKAQPKKNIPSKKLFTIVPLVKKISYANRRSIYRQIIKLEGVKFRNGRPACRLIFDFTERNGAGNSVKLSLETPSFHYGNFDINSLNAALSLKGDKVFMDKLKVTFPGGGTVYSSGFIDLLEYKITGKVKVVALPSEMNRIVKFDDINIPIEIKLHELPITLSATLDNYSFASDNFQGEVNLQIPKLHCDSILVNDLILDLNIDQDRISASYFSLSTLKNKLSGNFDYYPKTECLDLHASADGAPLLFKRFIKGDNLVILNDVINSFTFPSNRDDIDYEFDLHLEFKDDPFYFVSSKVSMRNFKYNGISFEKGSTNIVFDSNALIIIPGMVLQNSNALATVSIVYDGTTDFNYCVKSDDFSGKLGGNNRLIAAINGNFPGSDVLVAIFPNWSSETLGLYKPIHIKAHGAIDFNEPSKTLFHVKVDDATCFWKKIPVDHLNCDLIFRGFNMELKNGVGKVYNGDLNLNYNYNFDTLKGDIDLAVHNANFAPIIQYLGQEIANPDVGSLSLKTKALVYYDKKDMKDADVFMVGKGSLSIKDADLWDVPIINEFGEFTAQWIGKDWGNLTTLDTDFVFLKDYLYSDNIRTNGTVISLSSYGSYYWNRDEFDFRIKAKVLERALPFKIISNIFNPLSSLLESRVFRKNGKTKWEKSYSFKKIFK